MRICFVCSSLEPGRDGVGDYTRLLAQEVQRRGHDSALISLNETESRLGETAHGDLLSDLGEKIVPSLRCSSRTAWRSRRDAALEVVNKFAPDWVSVQFVSYGFASQGAVYGLGNRLRAIAQGSSLHLMFHELWIGADRNASWKLKLLGAFQRWLILRLVDELSARVVHAASPAYLHLLRSNGVHAKLLPLFGAIPLSDGTEEEWALSELARAGIPIKTSIREHFWLFGLFGTLHPIWPPEPLFQQLEIASQRFGKQIVIVSIGRLGSGADLWRNLSQAYGSKFRFVLLGEQPAERVAEFFRTIDFGIATTPHTLIGKSATVAAMVEHGVPVIVNRDDVHFEGFRAEGINISPQIVKMDDQLAGTLPRLTRRTPRLLLPEIAARFISDLSEAAAMEGRLAAA